MSSTTTDITHDITPDITPEMADLTGPTPRIRLLQNVIGLAVWSVLVYVLPLEPLPQLWLALPVLLVVHRVVRRLPLSRLAARDIPIRRTALEWVVFVALVPLVAFAYLTGGVPSEDHLWVGVVVVVGVAVVRAFLRRGVLALAAVLVALTVVTLAISPRLDVERSGDPALLTQLAATHGYHRLSVALIDLNAAVPVRYADVGSTPTTRFEVGSITKALTGPAIADEVDRGELRLDDSLDTYLPLDDCPAGRVSLRDLVTHSSGYPRQSDPGQWRNAFGYAFGVNSEGIATSRMEREIEGLELGPHEFVYSNLGAAAAGQAAARAAHLSYPDLMQTRIFAPLGMTDTAIATVPLVEGGYGTSGRPGAPVAMDGLAPSGAAVSTSADLAKVVVALLNGTAPGMSALEPIAATDDRDSRSGILWGVTTEGDGSTITEKNGTTQGYSSYLALDRTGRRGVVALADVDRGVDMIGGQLLATG